MTTKTRAELEVLWANVRVHLESAAAILPQPKRSGDEGGSIAGYREFLGHNELELAFDELDLLGQANDVPAAYWQQLAAAADLMDLENRAAACRARIKGGERGHVDP